jgi:hypothetical protein
MAGGRETETDKCTPDVLTTGHVWRSSCSDAVEVKVEVGFEPHEGVAPSHVFEDGAGPSTTDPYT